MHHKTIETSITIYKFDELSDRHQLLINKAKEEVKNAYAPYSGFCVGAAVELENEEIITGSNQENSAYPAGICAERVALFYANSRYPGVPVKTVAIAAFTKDHFLRHPVPPCGACRQAFIETEVRFEKSITILLYGTENVYLIEDVKSLLPLSFEKDCLND